MTIEILVMRMEEQPQVIKMQTEYVMINCGFEYDKKTS